MWNLGPGRSPKALFNYMCAQASTLHHKQNNVRVTVRFCKLIINKMAKGILRLRRRGPQMNRGPHAWMAGFSIELQWKIEISDSRFKQHFFYNNERHATKLYCA